MQLYIYSSHLDQLVINCCSYKTINLKNITILLKLEQFFLKRDDARRI